MDENQQESEGPVEVLNAAVADTEGLGEVPVADHVVRFEAVHTALTDALGSIDEV
ncbi:hypothetical protein [Sciscionella sediminilitoris]|uniref:hypothetical protein n=1 Tax=Sciscionella sediminilitoris TaxID=1445613 RepID=UPI0018D08905|nr:hypothetical protein [Sciscionella sp. SE31]